jgi:hypothetical protein
MSSYLGDLTAINGYFSALLHYLSAYSYPYYCFTLSSRFEIILSTIAWRTHIEAIPELERPKLDSLQEDGRLLKAS